MSVYSLLQNKIIGSLVGVAIGDAMGGPIEKLNYDEIKKRYGFIDHFDIPQNHPSKEGPGKGYGRITDDTLMAMSVCNIYHQKKDHLDAYDMAQYMVDEITNKVKWIPEFGREGTLIERLFYPEKYIFLRNGLANVDPRRAGEGNMVNCGAAMYVAPIGLINACDPAAAYKEAVDFTMAHQTSYGVEAAGVIAAAVAQAMVPGTTVEEIMDVCISLAKDGTKMALQEIKQAVKDNNGNEEDLIRAFRIVIRKYNTEEENLYDRNTRLTDAYTPSRVKTVEEVPVALGYCLFSYGDFKKGLLSAVNYGRDADSIASMTAAILGAMNGIESVPEKYVYKVSQASKYDFIHFSKEFAKTAKQIYALDQKRLQQKQKKINTLLGKSQL